MTFLRVIKWISFVVFILAIAVCGVGNGFVIADMHLRADSNEIYKADYSMQEIKAELKNYDDPISKFFNRSAAKAEELPVDTLPSEEPPVNFDLVIPDTPDNAPADAIAPSDDSAAKAEGGYSLQDKNVVIATIMKYGTLSSSFAFITKHISNMENCEINICLFVAFCALLLAFIMQLITKKTKSVYGYLLMIIGFLFGCLFLLSGYYFSEVAISDFSTFFTSEQNDWAFYRFIFMFCMLFMGTLIGLPIYRCGVRQLACKRLKKRIFAYQRKLSKR